jgi:hypothetical protein
MKPFLLAVFVLASLSFPAQAFDLRISGEDQTWTGSGTSPTFTVGIENNGVTGSDYLAGWSLGLSIAPESGAVGSLSFATVSLPSNYLLDGNSEVQSGFGFIPSNPSLPATSILRTVYRVAG